MEPRFPELEIAHLAGFETDIMPCGITVWHGCPMLLWRPENHRAGYPNLRRPTS
jgi:hypothetical protein